MSRRLSPMHPIKSTKSNQSQKQCPHAPQPYSGPLTQSCSKSCQNTLLSVFLLIFVNQVFVTLRSYSQWPIQLKIKTSMVCGVARICFQCACEMVHSILEFIESWWHILTLCLYPFASCIPTITVLRSQEPTTNTGNGGSRKSKRRGHCACEIFGPCPLPVTPCTSSEPQCTFQRLSYDGA